LNNRRQLIDSCSYAKQILSPVMRCLGGSEAIATPMAIPVLHNLLKQYRFHIPPETWSPELYTAAAPSVPPTITIEVHTHSDVTQWLLFFKFY